MDGRAPRWAARFWLGSAALAGLVALAAAGLMVLDHGLGGLQLSLFAFALGWAVAVPALWWRPRGRAWLAPRAPQALLLGAAMVPSLLILELAIRLVAPASAWHPMLPLYPNQKRVYSLHVPKLRPTVTVTTNRLGFRGDEPPEDWEEAYTILAVGGSTTLCSLLDDDRTWPYRLQEKLKVLAPRAWVGNAGCDGQTTRAHIVVMRDVVAKLRPDAVIVLAGYNDLSLSIVEERRGAEVSFDDPHSKGGLRARLKNAVFYSSRLLQVLETWRLLILRDATPVFADWVEDYRLRPLARPAPALPEDLESLLPQLTEYRGNLREMIRLGRAAGTRMVFLTQPGWFDDTPRWEGVSARPPWLQKWAIEISAAGHARLLAAYNRATAEVCGAEGVEWLDLAARVPHDGRYYYDPAHYTEEGAELVAEEVFRYLRDAGVKGG